MLSDYERETLSRALVKLEKFSDALDEMLVKSHASSGLNAGKPPARRTSMLPLVVSMLDLKIDVQTRLGVWCEALVRDAQVDGVPPSREVGLRARWLRQHMELVAVQVWADMAVMQLTTVARLVEDVMDPPERDPVEPPEVGTAREVAQWCALFGVPTSRSTIQRMISRGVVGSEVLPDGRVVVELAAVLAALRGA